MVILSPGLVLVSLLSGRHGSEMQQGSSNKDLYRFHLKFDNFLIKMDTFQAEFDTTGS